MRLTRRVTANLGVRWEIYYPFAGEKNLGTFIPGVQSVRFPNAPLGLLAEGDPGVPEGVLPVSYTRFAPRVGFAVDLFGDGGPRCVAATRIFYSFSQETFIGNLEQQPFTLGVTLNNTTNWTNPYAGQSAFPAGSPFPYVVNLQSPVFTKGATFSGIKPGTSAIPYLQQYNVTFEQQFGADWSTRMSYVGNVGRHFYLARDQNAPIYGSNATTANAPSRRPYASQRIYIGDWDARSSEQLFLQFLAAQRDPETQERLLAPGHRMFGRRRWTLSRPIPVARRHTNSLINTDVSRDYGPSSLHVPHRFVASFIYQLPSVNL